MVLTGGYLQSFRKRYKDVTRGCGAYKDTTCQAQKHQSQLSGLNEGDAVNVSRAPVTVNMGPVTSCVVSPYQ